MKRTITDDTVVRVCRSFKEKQYLNPTFYLTTTVGNLRELGICKHTDALKRLKAELATGVLTLMYDNQGTCYGIGVDFPEPVYVTVAIQKHAEPEIRLFKSEAHGLFVLSNEFTMEEEEVPAKTLDELNEFLGGQIAVYASMKQIEEA